MKEYFVYVNGLKVSVTKAVKNEYDAISGISRHERYVVNEAKAKKELSLEKLLEDDPIFEYSISNSSEYTDELVVRRLLISSLNDCLNCLSTDDLFIISQYFYNNMDEKEIAMQLGISQQAINKKKHKLIAKLKKFMKI